MKKGTLQISIGIIFVFLLTSACREKVGLPYASNSNSKTNISKENDSNKIVCLPIGIVTNTNSSIIILPQELIGLNSNTIVKMEQMAEQEKTLNVAINLADYYGMVKPDVEKQIKYLKIAAAQGDVPSQYNLGFIYSHVPEVKDIIEAKHWFSVAAESGDFEAKIKLKALEDNQ